MIAEGRLSVVRRGWILVIWGVAYIAAVAWQLHLSYKEWAWPVCIVLSLIAIVIGKARQRLKGMQTCEAAILLFVGSAHAVSAKILRWKVQGAVAVLWCIGGIAVFFVSPRDAVGIFVAASFLGMVLFGLYAMMLERREANHA
jgi:hypothetical protein